MSAGGMHINLYLFNSLFGKIEKGPMNTGNLRRKNEKEVEGTRDMLNVCTNFGKKNRS